MKDEKPSNVEAYIRWLDTAHSLRVTEATKNHYDTVAGKVLRDFSNSTFWKTLLSELGNYDQAFYAEKRYRLFISPNPEAALEKKDYSSFLLKTFRKNVIENRNWPDPPQSGWILPPTNWYSRVNDIVRTRLVVKYLDGIEFLLKRIRQLAADNSLSLSVDYEARQEGYYAVHAYVAPEFDIPRQDWTTVKVPVQIEIQVTTQLQEVICRLLHKYYESRRVANTPETVPWQWNFRSEEFSANYLGHILHYLEAMILEIREKQALEKTDETAVS